MCVWLRSGANAGAPFCHRKTKGCIQMSYRKTWYLEGHIWVSGGPGAGKGVGAATTGGNPQRPPCQGRLRGLAGLPCSETGVFLQKCLKTVWWHDILHCVYLAFQNSTFAVRGKDRKPGEVWKWAALAWRPWAEGQARPGPAAGGILVQNER